MPTTPNLGSPAGDRMRYLASKRPQNSSAYTALMGEGYGAEMTSPSGSDAPESAGQILGKAASLVLNYYASQLSGEMSRNAVLGKMWVPLQAVYLAIVGEKNASYVKGEIFKLLKTKGTWENLTESKGFGGDSAFGSGVAYLLTQMNGGNSEERKLAFAVALNATYAARYIVGEHNFMPQWATYNVLMRYFNIYYRAYGADATPNMPLLSISGEGLQFLFSEKYTSVFTDITQTSPQNTPQRLTMFGFEDISEIFQSPIDLQLQKDAELQVYNLIGEIDYDKWWWFDTPNCEDTLVPMKNAQDKTTGYMNIGPTSFPCVDESRDVTPITGTAFERRFVEAPPVSGWYDNKSVPFIQDKTREYYPPVAYYGNEEFIATQFEDYKDDDCRWLTSYASIGSAPPTHYVTDTSNYEPYYFINNHEGGAGNPWPGWDCGQPGLPGGLCSAGVSSHTFPEDCEAAGHEWLPNFCIHPGPPSPYPFPGANSIWGSQYFGFTRDMSLRHSLRAEDADPSLRYWEDINSWEFTGFVMAPLQFTPARLEGVLKKHLTNPKLDGGNLGRRAFSFGTGSTARVLDHTCGPPQAFEKPSDIDHTYNFAAGPFVYGQVWAENRTKRQAAKLNLFAGWPYRYYRAGDGIYDLHHTGGFNFPLIDETYAPAGWAAPGFGGDGGGTLQPSIDFAGKSISSNLNVNGDRAYKYVGESESWFIGTGLDENGQRHQGTIKLPEGYGDPWDVYDPNEPDPFHYNGELIVPHKFFGMGDACLNTPTKTVYSLNAGQRYSFHEVDVEKITHPHLLANIDKIKKYNEDDLGAEGFFLGGILGQWGEKYWDEFVTGWINTGHADHPYAGEAVSCLHPRTGYSTYTGSPKTQEYYWLGGGINDVHFDFPFDGVDCLVNQGQLAPYPNTNQCCEYVTPPFWGPEDCAPTTTPNPNTTTTTTCDPYGDPCTTTTQPPGGIMQECDPPGDKIYCMDGVTPPGGYYNPDWGICNWEQCISAMCEVQKDPFSNSEEQPWASGVYPKDRGWAEMTTKQSNENPPRYWRGPYASTHFTFLYPNAQAVLETHYPPNTSTPITGFPEKVFFDVEIEEWISKDFISGGYIDADGEIIWDKKLFQEEVGGHHQMFKEENTGYRWGNLVDERYVPPILSDEFEDQSKDTIINIKDKVVSHDIILNYNNANGRNIETYNSEVGFDRGNQRASGVLYGYGTSHDNASWGQWHFHRGGFHHYTGYSFPIESTYAKPTFTLNTLTQDTSSIVNAMAVGNELHFRCEGPDREVYASDYLDPIYFMPMESNLKKTGEFNIGGQRYLSNPYTETFVGSMVHQKQIYGDHWMGLRPQSMYSAYWYEIESGYNGGNRITRIAGSPGSVYLYETGHWGTHILADSLGVNDGYEEECMLDLAGEMMAFSEVYWCENIINCYPECTGVQGPPALNEVSLETHPCLNYYKDGYGQAPPLPGGIGIRSARGCDDRVWLFNMYASGLDVHVRAPVFASGYLQDANEMPKYDGLNAARPEDFLPGGSEATAAFGFNMTGTNVVIRESGIGVAGASNKQIDFFQPGWLDERELNLVATIYSKDGVLFEKPTQDWEITSTGYETIYQHGKRMAEVGNEDDRIRVSGWKELTQVKIKMKNFGLSSYGAFPNDSYWAMEPSGNCRVTGNLTCLHAAEASIYSEGIVMEDKSQDPLRDVLQYPHYASQTIKRHGEILPYGHENTNVAKFEPGAIINPMKFIFPAPSRMLLRKNEWFIMGTGIENYHEILKGTPYYYNRYIWATQSDMANWNGEQLSWEGLPPYDNTIYPVSQLMTRAAAGQPTPDAERGEYVKSNYAITQHVAFYDGVVLDPTINREWRVPIDTKFNIQPDSSYMVPQGTTVNDIRLGAIPAQKHTLHEDGSDSTTPGGETIVGYIT